MGETPGHMTAEGRFAVGLLAQQCQLCRRLAALSERQRELITGDEPEGLLTVLGERQKVLDGLGQVGERLRPYQQRWREVRAGMDERTGGLAERLLAEVNMLLATILKKDEADAQVLAARKHATASTMSDLKQTRQAGAAYAAAGAGVSSNLNWTVE